MIAGEVLDSHLLSPEEWGTIEAYNCEGEAFAAAHAPVKPDDSFIWLRSKLPAKPSLLDIGCGFGRHISALEELGIGQYVGIDASTEMLKLARRDHPTKNFRLLDLHSLDRHFPAKSFDAFLAICVLMHVCPDRLAPTLTKIRTVLKWGSVGLISLPEGPCPPFVRPVTPEGEKGPCSVSHAWPAKDILALAEACGFEVCRVFSMDPVIFFAVKAV